MSKIINKIKCKKEGRIDIYIPEKESLKEFIKLQKFEKIHNFIPSGMLILGANHEVESVLKDIDKAEKLAVFTDKLANMGHSLALIKNNKLECYDIGEIKKENIELKLKGVK